MRERKPSGEEGSRRRDNDEARNSAVLGAVAYPDYYVANDLVGRLRDAPIYFMRRADTLSNAVVILLGLFDEHDDALGQVHADYGTLDLIVANISRVTPDTFADQLVETHKLAVDTHSTAHCAGLRIIRARDDRVAEVLVLDAGQSPIDGDLPANHAAAIVAVWREAREKFFQKAEHTGLVPEG